MKVLTLTCIILVTFTLSPVESSYLKKQGNFARMLKGNLKMCYAALNSCKQNAGRLQSELADCNETLQDCSGSASPKCPDLAELFSGETGITVTPKNNIVNSADISCVNAATGVPLIFVVTCTQLADGSSLDWVNTATPINDSQNLLSVVQDACNSPFGK